MNRPKTPSRTPVRVKDRSNMEPVEVYCRLRPTEDPDAEVCAEAIDEQTVQLYPPVSRSNGADAAIVTKGARCTFTYVFDTNATQKQVFDRVAYDLIQDLMVGKNGLLFSYGITGSGKTYTMTGNPKNIGILPRCLDTVFNSIQGLQAGKLVFKPDHFNGFDIQSEAAAVVERQRLCLAPPSVSKTPSSCLRRNRNGLDTAEWELCPRVIERAQVHEVDQDCAYAVFISYVEIYNNYIYDLLDPQLNEIKAPLSKILREDINHNMYVNNVVEVEVKSTDEAFNIFIAGQQYRRVAQTVLNTESSRSHSVFNIRLVQVPLDETGRDVILDKTKVCVSQLSLVDLAGSERSSRTGHVGDRIREAGCINQSLMVLRQCIEQLRFNQQTGSDKMVPYRESRITHLFKNYFDGQGRVRMVVCTNPVAEDYDENLYVMQFAELTQEVEVPRAVAVHFGEERLTPGRRRAAEILKEVQDSLKKEISTIDLKSSSSTGSFFGEMPDFELASLPLDSIKTLICQLRAYFQQKLEKRNGLLPEAIQKDQQFEEALTQYICQHRTMKRRHEEMIDEMAGVHAQKERMHSDVHHLKAKMAFLQRRLDRYEQDAKFMQNQEQLFKKREKEMEAKVRRQDQKLRAVKQIFDDQNPKFTTPSKTLISNEPASTRMPLSAVQSRIYPALPQPYLSSADGNQHLQNYLKVCANKGRRAPSPPPRPTLAGRGRCGHRRSKSSSGVTIDHRSPFTVAPPGQIFQPKLHHRKVWGNADAKDLNKATDYVLRHQEVDPNNPTDVCSTLVKGEVIPTVLGGSKVVFNDVEQVIHHDPTDWPSSSKKQKSDDEA